jgi:hypothetical protein
VIRSIDDSLPLPDSFDSKRSSILREPLAGQMARVRFDPGAEPPVLNSAVQVHMYDADLVDRFARAGGRFFGLNRPAP